MCLVPTVYVLPPSPLYPSFPPFLSVSWFLLLELAVPGTSAYQNLIIKSQQKEAQHFVPTYYHRRRREFMQACQTEVGGGGEACVQQVP